MKVQTIVVGAFGVNCYILSGVNGRAVVIDPGDDAGQISRVLQEQRLQVMSYWITHGHMDHVSALAELCLRFPAPVHIHASDAVWAFHRANAMPPYYEAPGKPACPLRHAVEGQVLTADDAKCCVMETPGHSPGCICFHFPGEKMIFTGDTLFAGSVGRTDLSGGDESLLARSLETLTALPDETTIFPGHGPQSTIAMEKRSNPFLRR